MKVVYETEKVRLLCTSLKAAKKHFGGNEMLACKLFARINSLEQAPTIKDIVVQQNLHFHNLANKDKKNLDGYFAIDIAGRKFPWRLIIQPLDKSEVPFEPCRIDEIASMVEVVKIVGVSNYYD